MAPPSEFKHIIAIQNRTHTITAAIYNLISIFFSVIRRSDERSVHYAQFFPILPHTNFRFSPKTYQPAYCNLVFLPHTHTHTRARAIWVCGVLSFKSGYVMSTSSIRIRRSVHAYRFIDHINVFHFAGIVNRKSICSYFANIFLLLFLHTTN